MANSWRKHLGVVIEIPDAAAHREDVAEVLGQAFIHPEEPGILRGVEVASDHAGGPAVLAAPGVDVFVGEKIAYQPVAKAHSARFFLDRSLFIFNTPCVASKENL